MTISTVRNNTTAQNAYRNLKNNNTEFQRNIEKLSSGYKINTAGDDAAGLAISEKMRAQVTGLGQAKDNVDEGVNLVRTAEGALQEMHDMLNRVVELSTQAANGTYEGYIDRDALQKEVNQIVDEINRIADYSKFNEVSLLNGNLQNGSLLNLNGTGLSNSWNLSDDLMSYVLDASGATVDDGDYFVLNDKSIRVVVDQAAAEQYMKFDDTSGETVLYVTEDVLKNDQSAILENIFGSTGTGYSFDLATAEPLIEFDSSTMQFTCPIKVNGEENWIGNSGLTLQIGDTSNGYNQFTIMIEDMHGFSLGLNTVSLYEQDTALDSIDKVKTAINSISFTRAGLGATTNRLEATGNVLSVGEENIQNAESVIRDTDVAEETMKYAKNNITQQAASTMLANANQLPESVLQLLNV